MDMITLFREKKVLLFLLFLFSAGSGFCIISYMVLNDSGKKTKADVKVLAKPTLYVNDKIKDKEKTNAVNGESTAGPGTDATSPAAKRDVFREFYLKRPLVAGAAKSRKNSERMLETNLSDLVKLSNSSQIGQSLPPVHASVGVSSQGENITEVKISGIVCSGEHDCAAITNVGVLRKGAKIADETVSSISAEFVRTDRRTVVFN